MINYPVEPSMHEDAALDVPEPVQRPSALSHAAGEAELPGHRRARPTGSAR